MRPLRGMARGPSDLGRASALLLCGTCIEAEVWKDIGGRGGERRSMVRCQCNQRADPNEEVRNACPVQYDGNYHGAARRSAIVHVVIYHGGDPHRRLPERGANPDLRHGLKERIGYKSGLKR